MNYAKELITSSSFITLNKNVIDELGVECAYTLSVLSEAETLLSDEEGWFYQTASTLQTLTKFTPYRQSEVLKVLIDKGIIIQKNKGLPMKRHFKINYEVLSKLVFKNFENCMSNNLETNIQKTLNNKEYINKQPINKQNNINTLDTFFESIWKMYPKKKGKGQVSKSQKKKLYDIGIDEMTRCLERVNKYYTDKKTEEQFMQQGSTFFNSGYVDYLDNNYEQPTNERTSQNVTGKDTSFDDNVSDEVADILKGLV